MNAFSNYKESFGQSDIRYMSLAIRLAEKGRGKTNPNPMVGAVIVKDDRIISTGFHKKAGGPHAEIEAINNSEESLDGSTMYVTLEPCTIYGKTPPCVNKIVKHKFKEVVIGSKDPNPLINGKGIEFLKQAGIKVRLGLLEDKISLQNEVFFKHIKTKSPFVCCKIASSIDGKLATMSGNSRWITAEKSRKMVQKLRKEYGCVLTGINTVAKDNPFLFPRKNIEILSFANDSRAFSKSIAKRIVNGRTGANGLFPTFYRVILDSTLKIDLNSNIVKTSDWAKTIIFANIQNQNKTETKHKTELLKEKNITVVFVPPFKSIVKENKEYPILDINKILETLYNQFGITSILLESGPTLLTSFLENRLIDKFYIFLAPKIIGESKYSMFLNLNIDKIESSLQIEFKSIRKIGDDILVIAYPKK